MNTKMIMGRYLADLLLLVLWIGCQASTIDKKPAGLLISPIEKFQASLVASASHGTTLALQTVFIAEDGSNQEAVLLILHQEGTKEDTPEDGIVLYAGDIAVESKKIVNDDIMEMLGNRLSVLDPNTIGCMTGLASDVDFLIRALQKGVESHRSVHDGETFALSQKMSSFQQVQALSRLMQDSCIGKGSRPYGVQTLFVGRSADATKLDIFTVDPGGSIRHWKRGSAIGKNGFAVCKRLLDYRVRNPLEALKQGIIACAEECGPGGHFSAFLLRSTTRSIDLKQIRNSHIKDVTST